jgi:hypothetical protein
MIAEKILSVSSALGVLAGQVSEEQWQLIKLARRELSDAADTAAEMEARLECPHAVHIGTDKGIGSRIGLIVIKAGVVDSAIQEAPDAKAQ